MLPPTPQTKVTKQTNNQVMPPPPTKQTHNLLTNATINKWPAETLASTIKLKKKKRLGDEEKLMPNKKNNQ